MKLQRLHLLPAAALIALAIGAPGTALAAATERVVYQSSADCTSSDTVKCYTTVKSAIEAADETQGDSITIKPGTYTTEPLTLDINVSITGTETARTIISGGGSGTIITISGASGISIRKLTFISATSGIRVTNSSSVDITNNVFWLGTSGTAISVESSSLADIINDTFYQNGTAISTAVNITIKNNIFSNNTHHVTASGGLVLSSSYFTYNAFNDTNPDGPDLTSTTNLLSVDPLFVDPATATRDFHLQEGSPCIDAGDTSIYDTWYSVINRSDIGAYGGPNADTIPFQVSELTITGTTSTSISLDWTSNNSYLITTDNINNAGNPRGYRVYYGSTSTGTYDGTDADEGTSPIKIDLHTVSAPPYTLTGLSPAVTAPAAPTLNPVEFANETLILSWPSVSGATGYKVYYGTSSPPTTPLGVGNVTSYTLTGLTNGTTYYVAVSSYAQTTYYIAVTAYDNTNQTLSPGVSHESAYSQEVTAEIGSVLESGLSNILSEYPESITAYPNLPNKGCFIATAAYGYYSAPQVQALREFRDKYLMTNTPGRAFVGWYYTYGPFAAQFINDHPGLKPVVRVALLPAVGGAMFMTRTSALTKMFALAFIGLMGVGSVWVYPRRKNHRPR
ncbi:MAG: CFI-box-CTERM domain-containing protein [Nitrospirota bacterium]